MTPFQRLGAAVFAGLLTGFAGLFVGAALLAPRQVVRRYPLPHHVSKHSGGLSLRLAMAHDCVHERYPAHGEAFHTDRRRKSEKRLAELPPGSPEAFDVMDDLGASLDKLGRPAEAAAVLRDKLARQDAAGVPDDKRYTTFANLGTFLVHAHIKAALAGDGAATDRVREGLGFVERSIAVNPGAHFGREEWQARIIRFMLEVADDPELLTRMDCVGNCLFEPPPADGRLHHHRDRLNEGSWEEEDLLTYGYIARQYPEVVRGAVEPSDETRTRIRKWVPKVGDPPVPFDEPVLGILGMWREGGGSNPHFALALGEIMLRVGQRFLAWTAFERAARLADRYHAKPELQQFLRDHCRRRQEQIELTLDPSEAADLRPKFEAELAHGQRYQREYQEYEAKQLAAGVPPGAADFYAGFETGRPPIASKVGEEEWYVTGDTNAWVAAGARAAGAGGLFGFGLGAFAAGLLLRRYRSGLRGRLEVVERPAL